ncbi:EamA-like transporter family protein [Prosthecobacter fusiformis]|uniref:EamA-like transporter family protein n=1 Tax=Prosthecobacter fusiformis TaxID=48464 RepID=A0A4R7RM63_9BACT|nr:EamA family transporter [Prosthecobacter fusiformis]TDU66461.1 EamA-like transporter family protein [Prosthecobacter fusiformis]
MRNYLLLHLVILAWGFTAILGKLITLPPIEVVLWRTAIASAGFAILVLWQKQRLQVSRADRWKMLGIGALLGLHWILFFQSARLATASVSLAALPTAMLWCSLIEPLVDGTRRWRPLELLVGTVIVGAVWMIYEVELRYWLGFTVGIISAFLAALFSVTNKQLVARQQSFVMGYYQMQGALVVTALAWICTTPSQLTVPGPWDALWLFILSTVCTVGAYAGYMTALRHMSVFTVNVVYNLEPIYGIVLAVLIFGSQEHMSSGFYIGASIIIGSVLLIPWLNRWVTGERTAAVKEPPFIP